MKTRILCTLSLTLLTSGLGCGRGDDFDERDRDGDGVVSEEFGGPDCDDNDPTVLLCDDDTDDEPDTDDVDTDAPDDTDGDTDPVDTDAEDTDVIDTGDPVDPLTTDDDGDGFSEVAGDCDDGKVGVNPWATDLVGDTVDQDCDGVDGTDADADGFASKTSGGVDCDDTDDDVHPDAAEWCNHVDDDCNGEVDDGGTQQPFYRDADGDGYGAGAATNACFAPDGYSAIAGDCNDAAVDTHPDAEEICDSQDNNCDGIPEGLGGNGVVSFNGGVLPTPNGAVSVCGNIARPASSSCFASSLAPTVYDRGSYGPFWMGGTWRTTLKGSPTMDVVLEVWGYPSGPGPWQQLYTVNNAGVGGTESLTTLYVTNYATMFTVCTTGTGGPWFLTMTPA